MVRPGPAHALDYSRLPEAELVRLALAKDAGAARAIVQANNQHLFRVARAIVGDEAEAEDVLQEAYVAAFAHLSSFRAEAKLSTWLTRIVINEARRRLRRKKPQVGLEILDDHAMADIIPFPGAESDPEAAAGRAQMRRMLERAVDGLPDSFRLVFMLRDVEGLSIEETAAQTGVKAETVKTRLHRARRMMQDALRQEMAAALSDAFPFLGARCERITRAVIKRLRVQGLVED